MFCFLYVGRLSERSLSASGSKDTSPNKTQRQFTLRFLQLIIYISFSKISNVTLTTSNGDDYMRCLFLNIFISSIQVKTEFAVRFISPYLINVNSRVCFMIDQCWYMFVILNTYLIMLIQVCDIESIFVMLILNSDMIMFIQVCEIESKFGYVDTRL